MQTPTRMDPVVIKDYYHMKTMAGIDTYVISLTLNFRAPFCTYIPLL